MILPTHTHIIQLYTLILLEAIEACFVVLDGNRGDVAVQMRAEEEMPMEAEKAAIYQILILLSPYGHWSHHVTAMPSFSNCLPCTLLESIRRLTLRVR